MMAISVRQPWAWAIVHAGKPVENRTWRTSYRGPLLIHAAKGMTKEEYDDFRDFYEMVIVATNPLVAPALPAFDELQRGGIVGRGTLTDCVRQHPSLWFSGPYGFVLADVEPVPFQPYRGQLQLFDVPEYPNPVEARA